MSITRRQFLSVASMTAAGFVANACTGAPQLRVARPLTIWTLHTMIDDVLARWRRLNPAQQIVRVPVTPDEYVRRLADALNGSEPIPDIVVASTDILAHFSEPGTLYALNDDALTVEKLAQVGVIQTQTADQRQLALPLAINPLGVWYRSDVLHHAGLPQQPDNVTEAIGSTWDDFLTFGMQIRHNLPDVAWCADAFSDVYEPLSRTEMSYEDAARLALRVRQQLIDVGVSRDSGGWFDVLQRDLVAMVVAGSWMQETLSRTVRPDEFPWRVIAPPGGCIAGASLAIAITEASNQRDVALKCMQSLVFDEELQLILSDSSHVIPALTSTYQNGRFQRTDAFCAGQYVGRLWTDASQRMRGYELSKEKAIRDSAASAIVRQAMNGTTSFEDALRLLTDL